MKVWPIELRCSCGEHDGWQLEVSPEAAEAFVAAYTAEPFTDQHARTGVIGDPIDATRAGWVRSLADVVTVDNPLITPENPLGAWNLPYEEVAPAAPVTVWSITCDSVDVTAGSTDTPLGRFPVLVLDFHSSALPAEDHPPRITFVGTIDVMRNLRKLLAGACNGAIRAAGGDA